MSYEEMVVLLSDKIVESLASGHTVFFAGNGGSAELSNHFAGELVGKYLHDREPLKGVSLCSNMAIITAIANDYGYENVFSRQLKAFAGPGDIFIPISTSGKSKNLLVAQKTAKDLGVSVIIWPIDGVGTPRVQEFQTKLMHDVCERVERVFL